MYSKAAQAAMDHLQALRDKTPCSRCQKLFAGQDGVRGIQWHHPFGVQVPENRVSQMAAAGDSIQEIDEEIERCLPVCASCHMRYVHGSKKREPRERRSTVPLTAAKVASLLRDGAPDKVPDGRSLYLVIQAPGVGQWKGQYLDHGRSRTKCLGSVADVKLADARSAWERVKGERRNGAATAPHMSPRLGRPVPTGTPYSEAAAEYVTGMAAEWRGGATGKYAKLFAADAKAAMPDGRVLGTLTWPELTDDVIAAYVSKMSERGAKDTRVRLYSVRTYQETGKLPTRTPKVEHHDSVPWKDVPSFYRTLDMGEERARALAFTILRSANSERELSATPRKALCRCDPDPQADRLRACA